MDLQLLLDASDLGLELGLGLNDARVELLDLEGSLFTRIASKIWISNGANEYKIMTHNGRISRDMPTNDGHWHGLASYMAYTSSQMVERTFFAPHKSIIHHFHCSILQRERVTFVSALNALHMG